MALIELTRFEGMSTIIAPEKQPPFLLQRIENMELMDKEGWLKKRKGYKKIITSGLTALNNMIEFVDKNDNRQILLLDGTTLKEIEYAAGAGYGAVSAIANDERNSYATISEFHPVIVNQEIRSGAGLNGNDSPIWYGYIPEKKRCLNSVTIAAGKYLTQQYDKPYILQPAAIRFYDSLVSSSGINNSTKFVGFYRSAVLDGYQRGIPFYTIGDSNDTSNPYSVNLKLFLIGTTAYPRVDYVDLFVAVSNKSDPDKEFLTAYFLERVSLNEDGESFYENVNATLDPAAQTITIGNISVWKTFSCVDLIVEDMTNGKFYHISSETVSSPNVTLQVSTYRDAIPTGAISPAHIRIRSGWHYDGSNWNYATIYDNFWKKLSSEMYDYLGIPPGDTGFNYVGDSGTITFLYKYAAYARKRYFACGFPDKYAYYSVPYSPDIIPTQNVIRLKKDPTGVVDVGDEEFILFYKDSADRILIVSNGDHRIDDKFLNIGCAAHESIVKVSDRVVAWMDYTGPYILQDNAVLYIGQHLKEWWYDRLTDSHKEACVGAFNRLKQWMIFAFPTYNDSDYPNGIAFVFDLNAHNAGKISPWWILKTDVPIKSSTLAYDLHLLTGSDTEIVDWNTTSTPDENVQASVLFKLLQNPLLGRKVNLKKMMLDFEYGSNTITANIYVDGGTTPAITITAKSDNKEQFIQYLMENFELEIKSGSDQNEFMLKSILLFTREKRVA